MSARGPRAELRGATLAVLAGAAALLVASAGDWATGTLPAPPPLPAQQVAAAAPGPVRALGLVVLAGVPALAATRTAGRLAVGLVLLAAGAAAGAVTVDALADPAAGLPGAADGSATARPLLALAGAVLTVLAGAVVAVRGPRWPSLGRRYEPRPERSAGAGQDRPATAAEEPPRLWDALDRGEDPTRG